MRSSAFHNPPVFLPKIMSLRKETSLRHDHWPIDDKCEYGRFPLFASCVTISNPNTSSSSETGVDRGIRH